MFRTVLLSIITIFSLYTQQWYITLKFHKWDKSLVYIQCIVVRIVEYFYYFNFLCNRILFTIDFTILTKMQTYIH